MKQKTKYNTGETGTKTAKPTKSEGKTQAWIHMVSLTNETRVSTEKNSGKQTKTGSGQWNMARGSASNIEQKITNLIFILVSKK